MSEVASSVGGDATTGLSRAAETTPPDTEAVAAQSIRRVLAASEGHDPVGLQAQLELAATALGLARCIDDVVLPAARQLRALVTTDHRDPAPEVMATEAIRTWLNHRGLFAPAPESIRPIVLACGPRDRHLVGLESLGLLLRFQRWPCRVLGARISTFTLTVAARAADAAGVVVMSNESRARQYAIASLRAVDAMDTPVFFAGDAFETEPSRREVPGRYLGTGMQGACALLTQTLAADVFVAGS